MDYQIRSKKKWDSAPLLEDYGSTWKNPIRWKYNLEDFTTKGKESKIMFDKKLDLGK